jgi:hypothetical protein
MLQGNDVEGFACHTRHLVHLKAVLHPACVNTGHARVADMVCARVGWGSKKVEGVACHTRRVMVLQAVLHPA